MLLNIVWCHTQANGRSICLGLTTLLLMCPLPQCFSEPRLHLFFFLLPKSEEEELCALYRHVKKVCWLCTGVRKRWSVLYKLLMSGKEKKEGITLKLCLMVFAFFSMPLHLFALCVSINMNTSLYTHCFSLQYAISADRRGQLPLPFHGQ